MNQWTTTPPWKNGNDIAAAIKEMKETIMSSFGVPAHLVGGEPRVPRTDLDRLLAAIRRDPADDLARLAYADALEEVSGGDVTDGRMIRAQIIRGAKYTHIPGGWRTVLADCDDTIQRLGLEVWIDDDRWRYNDTVGPPILTSTPAVFVVRGFLEEVRCPLQTWLDHGPAVVRWHPVRRVRVTDRGPTHVDRGPGFDAWAWLSYGAPSTRFPEYVCRKLERGWYATEEKAFDGLSETLIEIAEEVAGVRG